MCSPLFRSIYMGSAPRAADTARFARARKNATEIHSKGTERKSSWFGAASELIMPRAAACAKLVDLHCALCYVLVGDVTF